MCMSSGCVLCRYDAKKAAANKLQYPYETTTHDGPSKTQQFGVSLQLCVLFHFIIMPLDQTKQ